MLLIINSFLNDISKTEDGYYVGYIDSADQYNQFLTALKDAGFYFSVRDSERFKEDGQFLFKCNKSNVPVPFSGCPFRREKNITYQCAFGSQYYGKVKKRGSSEIVLGKCEKKSVRVRHSKKLGCKAKMAAKCIRIYLDYKIPSESSHWRLKKEVISTLKRDLSSKACEVKSLSRYFIKISGSDQHCHSPMHPRGVIRKLLEATKCKNGELGAEEDEAFLASNVIEGDVAYGAVCVVGEEGDLANLRELCRQKGREVATLSQHLCHDEDQLRDLLAVLTRVTDRLHDSQLEVMYEGEEEGVALPEEKEALCFPSDVSQTVVVEGEHVVEDSSEECCEEPERGIYLSGDDLVNVRDMGRAGETERLPSVGAQSQRLLKRDLASPGVIQTMQKRFSSSVVEISSEQDLQQGSEFDEGNVIFYLLG